MYVSFARAPDASAQGLPHPQHVVVLNIRPTPHRADALCYADMAQRDDDISHDIPAAQHDTPAAQHDTPNDISRYTVPEAAQALGISPEAVRNRLSRGTLKSVKESGTVYVLLDADMAQPTGGIPPGTPTDKSRYTTDTPHGMSGENAARSLLSAKDETIRVLREQLEAEREANRENRRIIAGLVQRVPELEATPEPREAPETASGGMEGVEVPIAEEKRSWWRKMFGA